MPTFADPTRRVGVHELADELVEGLTNEPTFDDALDELTEHLDEFFTRLTPGPLWKPTCSSSRQSDRVETVVAAFSLADDSAVHDAVERFEFLDKDVLLVVHEAVDGLGYSDLFDLRARLADELLGRYEVFSGHPEDPCVRAGVLARREPFPVLHLVRSERLIEGERRLSPRCQPPAECGP
jgi:hypothetical protein